MNGEKEIVLLLRNELAACGDTGEGPLGALCLAPAAQHAQACYCCGSADGAERTASPCLQASCCKEQLWGAGAELGARS